MLGCQVGFCVRDGRMFRGSVVPGNVVPGNVVPGNVVPGKVVPGNVVPGNVVPGNVVSRFNDRHSEGWYRFWLQPRVDEAMRIIAVMPIRLSL